jgi:hypothetical protein
MFLALIYLYFYTTSNEMASFDPKKLWVDCFFNEWFACLFLSVSIDDLIFTKEMISECQKDLGT